MRKTMLAALLVCGLIAAAGGKTIEVSAQDEAPILYDSIYFPHVPYGDMIDDTGPWYGSITVQNIEVNPPNPNGPGDESVRFWVFDSQTMNQIAAGAEQTVSQDDNSTNYRGQYSFADALEDPRVPRYDLDPNASLTLSASDLGLSEAGSAVAIYAAYKEAIAIAAERPTAAHDMGAPTIAGVQKQATASPMINARTTGAHLSVDGYSAIPFADVAWGSQSDFCHAIAEGVDSCDGTGFYSLPSGSAGGFDGHSYLPIVQTNSSWNTEIYLSNIDFTEVTAGQVNITLITSDQQGYAAPGEHKITETFNIPAGETVVMDISQWVGDDWVGSVHITSTIGIVTAAMRSNPDDGMLMINTSAPSLEQQVASNGGMDFAVAGAHQYTQYAPLIYQQYNGWNTGLSFVNIAEQTNVVQVTYYDAGGNVVRTDQRTISPQGQEFIYTPAQQDLGFGGGNNNGFVGSAIFTSDLPFHIAVDQVKYSTREAMSYLASAAGASYADLEGFSQEAESSSTLMVPLVQKGFADGSGDTSGLQVFNTSLTDPVSFSLTFFDSAGAAIPPTKGAPYQLTLGARQHATIYSMNFTEMAQNARASAVIEVTDGGGQIVGVSNNVNYSVGSDGSTAFNMVNTAGQYRFPAPGFANR